MTDPLQTLLQPNPLRAFLYPPNSRYSGVETATHTTPDGRVVAFLRRRFVPQPEQFALIKEHRVVQGERLDTIAHAELGDPLLFWRLCDANRAIRPSELTEIVGRRLRVTLPVSVSGATAAQGT